MHHDRHDTLDLIARGEIRRDGRERVAETWFHWCDPETGERLEVALGVSDAFRERLAAAGFQPSAEPTRSTLALTRGGRESGRPGEDAGSAAPAA